MRTLVAGLLLVAVAGVLRSQDAKEVPSVLKVRFGMDYQSLFYPQRTPQESMAAIVKAIDNQRIDYLLAHLVDPEFVDRRLEEYKKDVPQGTLKEETRIAVAFDRFVLETKKQFDDDPVLVKELRLVAKQAEWDMKEESAVGTLKGSPRKAFVRRVDGRWFLENRQR